MTLKEKKITVICTVCYQIYAVRHWLAFFCTNTADCAASPSNLMPLKQWLNKYITEYSLKILGASSGLVQEIADNYYETADLNQPVPLSPPPLCCPQCNGLKCLGENTELKRYRRGILQLPGFRK